MKIRPLRSIAAAFAGAVALSTAAAAAPPVASRPAVAPATNIVRVDARCGRGWHWVPPGYAKHGKWRNGHCAPD